MTLKLHAINAGMIDSANRLLASLQGPNSEQVQVYVPMSWQQLNTTHWAEIERQAIEAAKALTGH